jgi:uncharacterized protein (DUF305 family)
MAASETLERSEEIEDGEDAGLLRRFGPAQWVLLVAVLMFAAGSFGYWLGRPDRPGAGSAEVGFLHDMILHHEQAVAMAFVVVNETDDLEVRIFAKEILVSQQYEIGLMEAYLRRWGQRRESPDPRAMVWAGMAHPKEFMPGMATEDEMQQLDEAEGGAVNEPFLRLMIEHHAGGVDMAQAALERVDDEPVRELAGRIIKAQESEINEMQRTRQRLGFPPASTDVGH